MIPIAPLPPGKHAVDIGSFELCDEGGHGDARYRCEVRVVRGTPRGNVQAIAFATVTLDEMFPDGGLSTTSESVQEVAKAKVLAAALVARSQLDSLC